MIAHFSEILGVDYPWEKYAQIIVRDFVSGYGEYNGCNLWRVCSNDRRESW